MKTISILLFFLPLMSSAESLVTCQLQDFSACTDCEKRIPASCEGHSMTGSLELKIKPKKIQWVVSNSETGTEKMITTENKTLSLQDLKNAKDLKILAGKQKMKLKKKETVAITAVQLAGNTALYKEQTGSTVVTQMRAAPPPRAIASTNEAPVAGGVRRAQTAKEKK
ncbi:MAG: hypothetical protein ACAH59_00950 [Pseudobdellovibrionaceae bacterium]